MTTIPASAIVRISPSVLSAGGDALDLNGLFLTTSWRAPIDAVESFPSAAAVADYFGATSDEAALATIYFNGYENSTAKPGALLIAQYPQTAVAAWLRGGDVSDLTLAELQALSGVLALTIDGVLKSANINLSAATSFSSAALIIQAALGITGVQTASVTGSIAATTLTVSAVLSGHLGVGNVLTGTGVTASTVLSDLVTGTGLTGTYTVTPSQNAASQTITAREPAVRYDPTQGAFVIASGSVGSGSTITFGSGALSTSLKLTQVTGASISQGAAIAAPGTYMDALTDVSQNWFSFMTIFEPDAAAENTVKLAFAEWVNSTDDRFCYVCWDTDLSPSASSSAASSLGALIADAELAGTCLIGQDEADTDLVEVAAFVCGTAASIDFDQTNGRITFAFRQQNGLTATASSETTAANLIANGYNFYGAYATANDEFVWFYPGKVSGDFLWMDSYANEVWLNNGFQLALMTLLANSPSIPYNAAGNALIEAALADPINNAVNFGAIRSGVDLSAAQEAQVNSSAGALIAPTLEQRGWYLQVSTATPEVRAARGSPPCTFYYTDGQAVQVIDLSSVALQ